MTNRLLLLACSASKRDISGAEAPAWCLYDGPAWRVLRNYVNAHMNEWVSGQLVCYVISARYGLVHAMDHIAPYNQKLELGRVTELMNDATNATKLSQVLDEMADPDVLVWGGSLYADLATTWMADAEPNYMYRCAVDGARGIGDMLGELRKWLWHDPAAHLRGVELPQSELLP